uniref:Ycf54 n=1 Tax=Chondria tumulosa TaxID=2740715 RepID=A0A896SQB1_9FLOR|nr:hypothetical protein K8K75_pgp181 [Chondria tumulosa]QSD57026.1 hypothetical protein [Chondria tumulosa]
MYNYYFALASQSFFLCQEPVEEILRERTQYYKDTHKEIDFWFVLNPSFVSTVDQLNYSSFPDSLAAIVSSDADFIKWLKLRITFVCTGSFQSKSVFIPN